MKVATKKKTMDRLDVLLANRVFAEGPSALLDAGLTNKQQADFLARTDIQAFLRQQTEELKENDALLARTRFAALRALQRMAPTAVQIMADAMNGTVYEKNKDGTVKLQTIVRGDGVHKIVPVVKTYAPSHNQIVAAQDVLDRLGVHDKAEVDKGAGIKVNVLFNHVVTNNTLTYAPELKTEEEKRLSRERMRTVLQKLLPKIDGIKETLEESAAKLKKKYVKKKLKAQNGKYKSVIVAGTVSDAASSDDGGKGGPGDNSGSDAAVGTGEDPGSGSTGGAGSAAGGTPVG